MENQGGFFLVAGTLKQDVETGAGGSKSKDGGVPEAKGEELCEFCKAWTRRMSESMFPDQGKADDGLDMDEDNWSQSRMRTPSSFSFSSDGNDASCHLSSPTTPDGAPTPGPILDTSGIKEDPPKKREELQFPKIVIPPPPGFFPKASHSSVSEGSMECIRAINITLKALQEEGYHLKVYKMPEEAFMFWTEGDYALVKLCARLIPSIYPFITKLYFAACRNPTCSKLIFKELDAEYEKAMSAWHDDVWSQRLGEASAFKCDMKDPPPSRTKDKAPGTPKRSTDAPSSSTASTSTPSQSSTSYDTPKGFQNARQHYHQRRTRSKGKQQHQQQQQQPQQQHHPNQRQNQNRAGVDKKASNPNPNVDPNQNERTMVGGGGGWPPPTSMPPPPPPGSSADQFANFPWHWYGGQKRYQTWSNNAHPCTPAESVIGMGGTYLYPTIYEGGQVHYGPPVPVMFPPPPPPPPGVAMNMNMNPRGNNNPGRNFVNNKNDKNKKFKQGGKDNPGQMQMQMQPPEALRRAMGKCKNEQ